MMQPCHNSTQTRPRKKLPKEFNRHPPTRGSIVTQSCPYCMPSPVLTRVHSFFFLPGTWLLGSLSARLFLLLCPSWSPFCPSHHLISTRVFHATLASSPLGRLHTTRQHCRFYSRRSRTVEPCRLACRRPAARTPTLRHSRPWSSLHHGGASTTCTSRRSVLAWS